MQKSMDEKKGYASFLGDILWLSLFAFGGSQAHFPFFLHRLVKRKKYLREEELLELQALCQLLPGPTSTQTLVALGYREGGIRLALLSLCVWCLPACVLMTGVALFSQQWSMLEEVTRFVRPMAVAFVGYSACILWRKVVRGGMRAGIAIGVAMAAYGFHSPYVFPLLLLLGGVVTSVIDLRRRRRETSMHDDKPRATPKKGRVGWPYLILWAGLLVVAVVGSSLTDWRLLGLFKDFYKNGSMIFGGGQILAPFMYGEFVVLKEYLQADEFLSGFAMVQAVPGPIFSFTTYIGVYAMQEEGIMGGIGGACVAAAGIFIPGSLLVFFAYTFWDRLKAYALVRASVLGIHAASVGLMLAAFFLLFAPLGSDVVAYITMLVSLGVLFFTKLSPSWLILGGLLLGGLVASV